MPETVTVTVFNPAVGENSARIITEVPIIPSLKEITRFRALKQR